MQNIPLEMVHSDITLSYSVGLQSSAGRTQVQITYRYTARRLGRCRSYYGVWLLIYALSRGKQRFLSSL